MNDDWLIYILFFGEYDKRNNADTSKPIIIKHRKTNTLIYSGCDGHLPVIYKPFSIGTSIAKGANPSANSIINCPEFSSKFKILYVAIYYS